jgi:hypothetical protein
MGVLSSFGRSHRDDLDNKSAYVMLGTRFATKSVAPGRELAVRTVGLAVLNDVLAQEAVRLGRLTRATRVAR